MAATNDFAALEQIQEARNAAAATEAAPIDCAPGDQEDGSTLNGPNQYQQEDQVGRRAAVRGAAAVLANGKTTADTGNKLYGTNSSNPVFQLYRHLNAGDGS